MKVSIDHDADVLYVTWGSGGGASREVASGIYLTYDGEGHPVGIEVLGMSQRAKTSLEHLAVSYAPPGSSQQDPPIAQEFTIEFSTPVHA